MKKHILLLLLLTSVSCPMIKDKKAGAKLFTSNTIITGILMLETQGNARILYAPHTQQDIHKKLELHYKMDLNEPVVLTRSYLDDGSDFNPIELANNQNSEKSLFPRPLPLSILLHAKENQKINFVTCGNTLVRLTCKQKFLDPNDTFEKRMAILMYEFRHNPQCYYLDIQSLIDQKVVIQTGPDKFKHGENGYKF